MGIRILIVDDHKVVRKGLRMFLAVDPELEVVGEAGNGLEAQRLVQELEPDVVLMDLLMPVMDGITATEAIRRKMPSVEVIALTSVLEDSAVFGAMRAGAIGYLLKDIDAQELCRAIKQAAAGQVSLSPSAAERLLREVPAPKDPQPLTRRETEVLQQLAMGKSNLEIADALVIADKTVRTHVSNVLGKLGVSSRTQAALYALRSGLVTLDRLEGKP
jgi:two-component system, NarL family, response regulator LiaR